MNCRRKTRLVWLLILAVFTGGLQVAIATAGHPEHLPTMSAALADDDGNPGNMHDDHCCHIAGHLVGAVGEPGYLCASVDKKNGYAPGALRLRGREPPPIPPPTP